MDIEDVTGKVVVITGASAGIGAAAARRLGRAGATVVVVGRDPERTASVAAEAGGEPVVADFARLDDVKAAAEKILAQYDGIDVLANNAGGIFPRRTITPDGHELTFQVNHLAGYLLTELLLPRLSSGGRVIMTSSFGNRFTHIDFDDLERERRRYGQGWLTYCATKLMNILAARELAERTAGTGLDAISFHPEPDRDAPASSPDEQLTKFAADTWQMRLMRRLPGLRGAGITGAGGAVPLVWLASSPQVVGTSGSYYNGTKVSTAYNKQGKSEQARRLLADRSRAAVQQYL
jgi:NAD(P)-dependent dehydrogenase (short-subunit alcohol dehydrogenase family)